MKRGPALLLALLLLGCGKSEQPPSSALSPQERLAEDCRSGRERGERCVATDKALAEKEHREAQSAFRSMGGTR